MRGIFPVDDILPGMVLAADVCAPNGRKLFAAGTKLDARHLKTLKTWGVAEAEVETRDVERNAPAVRERISHDVMNASRTRLAEIFALSGRDHPALHELHQLCVLRAAAELSKGLPLSSDSHAPPHPCDSRRDDLFAPGQGTALTLIQYETELASFPEVYNKINQLIDSPTCSAMHLADVICQDPGLSTRLLQLVNSAFYGLPAQIDSIARAVAVIGMNELHTLTMGVAVIDHFQAVPAEYVDMRSFWQHSIACGVCARILAGHRPGLPEERLFIGGLIHDIGRIPMLRALPHAMCEAMRLAREDGMPLHVAERAVLGFDHAEAAGLLLESWNFPPPLVELVRHHHAPTAAPSLTPASVVHIADLMAVAWRFGTSGESHVPPLAPEAWECLGLTPSTLALVTSQAERQLSAVMNTLAPRAGQNALNA